jgi:excisionase family DNA binding protein
MGPAQENRQNEAFASLRIAALGTILAAVTIGAIGGITSNLVGSDETVWMSRAEVARILQVAPVTIGRWASQGKLPYSSTLGGRRRFRRRDIVAIARRLSQATVAPAEPVVPRPRRSRRR